jgi:hypothetical protein
MISGCAQMVTIRFGIRQLAPLAVMLDGIALTMSCQIVNVWQRRNLISPCKQSTVMNQAAPPPRDVTLKNAASSGKCPQLIRLMHLATRNKSLHRFHWTLSLASAMLHSTATLDVGRMFATTQDPLSRNVTTSPFLPIEAKGSTLLHHGVTHSEYVQHEGAM